MNSNPHHARSPADGAHYAALRKSDATSSDQRSRDDAGAMPVNDFQTEAERLRALREALWAAFDAGPAAGLPNVLIDLTMAYTTSLRLQLNLKALTTRQITAKMKVTPTPRGKPLDST